MAKPTQEAVKAFTVQMLDCMLKLADAIYGTSCAVTVKRRVTMRAARSHGGAHEVALNMGYVFNHIREDGTCRYWEYSGIENDAEIGAYDSAHWSEHVRALLAHEVAHVIQLTIGAELRAKIIARSSHPEISTKGIKGGQAMWHGHDWQAIYRELRTLTA